MLDRGPVRDPYELLGVSRNADDAELKAAFRRVAAIHHPDKNLDDPSAQARFTELNQAYQVLSDPQKRAAWDRFGDAAFRPGGFDPSNIDISEFVNMDGLFGDLLGAVGIRPKRAGDVRLSVKLTFEESVRGCTKTVQFDAKELCARCAGQGGEPGSVSAKCGACEGRGKQRPLGGMLAMAFERPCSHCRGVGRRFVRACTTCRGDGTIGIRRTQEVELPAGIEPGATRTIRAAGSRPEAQRPAGDLHLTVEVADHEFFKRVGDDLICKVPITFPQAALGTELEVPTLNGRARLRIPPATQPGHVLRMRGKGVPRLSSSGSGDQLVEMQLEIPRQLSSRARGLIEELSAELGASSQPEQRGFLDRLKGWF